MSLKATKCFLLKPKLEVLGYYITPQGIVIASLIDIQLYSPVLTLEVHSFENEYLHSVLNGLVMLLDDDFIATTTPQEDQALVNWLLLPEATELTV
jgi:hypothetical protein